LEKKIQHQKRKGTLFLSPQNLPKVPGKGKKEKREQGGGGVHWHLNRL